MSYFSSLALDNREIAVLSWMCLIAALGLAKPAVRASGLLVLKALFNRKLAIPWAIQVLYVILMLVSLNGWGLWSADNFKTAVIWMFFTATVMTSKVCTAASDQMHLLRAIRGGFAITVLLEFVVNTFVLHIAIELVLVPIMAILTAMATLVEIRGEYKPIRKYADAILATLGLALLLYCIYRLWSDFDTFAEVDTLVSFLLPLVMLLLYTPFLYGIATVCVYENTFVRLRIFMNDSDLRRFAKRALLLHCGFNYERVSRWWKLYICDRPQTRAGVMGLIRDSKHSARVPPEDAASLR